jgi:hypothetical protein
MAVDTAFNITWNQRVAKEETALLRFLDKRKKEEQEKNARSGKRGKQRAMSDVDLMSAVRSARDSISGSGAGAPNRGHRSSSDLRSRGSGASRSILQQAGSQCSSSPSLSRRKLKSMTFEEQQEHVFNQSMNQYIRDLESEAKEGKIEQGWIAQKIKDGHQQEIDEKAKARQLAQENQRQVRAQIEDNKNKRANSRKAFVEAASAHNFPLFTETFISQDEVDEYRKDVKKNFREDLDLQHKTQQVLRNIHGRRDQLYAAQKLAENIKNMSEDHKREHHEKLRKGEEMMRVWDRDIRLKNIKNAILNGKDATKEMGVS